MLQIEEWYVGLLRMNTRTDSKEVKNDVLFFTWTAPMTSI